MELIIKNFLLGRLEDLKKLQNLEIKYPKLKNLNCINVIKDIQKMEICIVGRALLGIGMLIYF